MLKRVIVAIIGLPIIFLILFCFPPVVLAGTVSIICAMIAYELLRTTKPFKGNMRFFIYTMISAAAIPMGVFFRLSYLVIPMVFLVLLSLTFIEAIIRFNTEKHYPVSFIFLSLFGGLFIPYLFSTLIGLRVMPHGRFLVLIPVLCAFTTDAGAYFVGVLIGKRKAFPHVSPNKTVAGCIGGVIFGTSFLVLFGVALNHLTDINFINLWALLSFGLIGSIMCELGDLTFSLIKRELNIKDFGSFLPGHGGALDRFDSMIFTAPTIYLLVLIFSLFNITILS